MINFNDNKNDSNLEEYIMYEYLGSLTNNLRLFFIFKISVIKLRKLLKKLTKKL